ncbi:MAG: phosphoadenylyl-sulfate reductase [Bacteroidales bacterium]
MIEIVKELNSKCSASDDLPALIDAVVAMFEDVVFTTSFGLEDQLVTDLIMSSESKKLVKFATLDTGRLFAETYKTMSKTQQQYGIKIKTFFPDQSQVETMVNEKGLFSFYESMDNRKECCKIRKVEGLRRALSGNKVWITGLRAEQSPARCDLNFFEWDKVFSIIKFNPIIKYTWDDTLDYVKKNSVPYNVLHDKGFVSIGCEPCTRAIKENEDFRSGRWWWESGSKKECGLHSS